MKHRFLLIPAALLVVLAAVACANMPDSASASCMTIQELRPQMKEIAARAQKENYTVSVCGFLSYQFEDENLLSERDAARSEMKCLGAPVPEKAHGLRRRMRAYHGSYVRLTGIPWVVEDCENCISFRHCKGDLFAVLGVQRVATPPGL